MTMTEMWFPLLMVVLSVFYAIFFFKMHQLVQDAFRTTDDAQEGWNQSLDTWGDLHQAIREVTDVDVEVAIMNRWLELQKVRVDEYGRRN
jgi:hypothetical protein